MPQPNQCTSTRVRWLGRIGTPGSCCCWALLLKNPSVEIRDIPRGKCCFLLEKRSETVESRTDQHLITNIHPMRGRPTKEEPLLVVAALE